MFFVSFTAAFFNDRRRLMPVVVPPISSSGCRRARRRARHLEQHPCSGGPRPENFPPVTLTAATILAFVAKDAVALANSTETSRNTYGCESTLSIATLRYSQPDAETPQGEYQEQMGSLVWNSRFSLHFHRTLSHVHSFFRTLSHVHSFSPMSRRAVLCRFFVEELLIGSSSRRSHASTTKQANDVRIGNVVSLAGGKQLARVTKFSHSQQGRQLAVVQLEARDVNSGSKLQLKFKTKDMVEIARLDERPHQFLYEEGGMLHFMDDAFEQVALGRSTGLDEDLPKDLLKPGETVVLSIHDDKIISASLPATVALEVVEATPAIKDATKQAQFKPVTVETGAKIQAPPYIKTGDVVMIDTSTREFVKRAT